MREEILTATIREWASTGCDPFPCGADVWAYACKLSGLPIHPLPEHPTRKAVATLLRNEGGLEAYARRLMLSLQWEETADPRRGDVGVVDIPGMGLTCAISLGSMWMAKGPHRVLTISAPHRAAWSLGECLKPSPPRLSQQSG